MFTSTKVNIFNPLKFFNRESAYGAQVIPSKFILFFILQYFLVTATSETQYKVLKHPNKTNVMISKNKIEHKQRHYHFTFSTSVKRRQCIRVQLRLEDLMLPYFSQKKEMYVLNYSLYMFSAFRDDKFIQMSQSSGLNLFLSDLICLF